MDIRYRLLAGGHTRANAERIAAYVGDDPHRFAELMGLMLHDGTTRVQQLAAHGVSVVCESHPDLATPYVKELLATLDRPVHEGVQRSSIRVLQWCALPKALHGRIADAVLARIADPSFSIAQRAFSITVAMRLVGTHPGLANELRLLLEEALRLHPSPGVRSRAMKALRQLAPEKGE